MAVPDIEKTVTLIGVILSFIVGTAGLWIGIKNSRKTIFINSITASRIKYIQDLRNTISEFCSSINAYTENQTEINKLDVEKRYNLYQKLINCTYLIKLYLNPEDKEWDNKILEYIMNILVVLDKNYSSIIPISDADKTVINNNITDLILITQYLLKLEWEGVKSESKKGNLSKNEKNKLYRKHVGLYKKSKSKP